MPWTIGRPTRDTLLSSIILLETRNDAVLLQDLWDSLGVRRQVINPCVLQWYPEHPYIYFMEVGPDEIGVCHTKAIGRLGFLKLYSSSEILGAQKVHRSLRSIFEREVHPN